MKDVKEFIEFNRPQVRQDQLIKHVTTAFNVDQTFKAQFAASRLILREEMKNWGDMVITNLGVFQRPDHNSSFKLIELAPGATGDEVAAKTTAHYEVAV